MPGADRSAGESPRLPHRAGGDRSRDRAASGGARGRGHGAGVRARGHAAGSLCGGAGGTGGPGGRGADAAACDAARVHGARGVRDARYHAAHGERQAGPQGAAGTGHSGVRCPWLRAAGGRNRSHLGAHLGRRAQSRTRRSPRPLLRTGRTFAAGGECDSPDAFGGAGGRPAHTLCHAHPGGAGRRGPRGRGHRERPAEPHPACVRHHHPRDAAVGAADA